MSKRPVSRPFTVALTGGIASGKTAVSDRFSELGITVVDTDVLARQVVEPGTPGLRAVVKHFGAGVLNADGSLNRQRLRDLVFADSRQRKQLEAILHPLIRQCGEQALAQASSPYAIYVIPLLAETGSADNFDRVLVVDVPVELQRARLMARSELSEQQAQQMIDAQASAQVRLGLADDVITNDGTLEQLNSQVAWLHQAYLELARNRRQCH